jgi:hypothetical protein
MKRPITVFILILLAFPVTTSAATTTWNKKAHTFRVSYPKIAVKLAETFVFEGKDTANNFGFFPSGGESGTNINSEAHLFIDKKQGKAVKIVVARLNRGYWKSDLTDRIKNPLDRGEIKGERYRYKYAVMAAKSKNGGCLLINRIARTFGASKQTLMECYYIQDVAKKLGNYSKWEKANTLDEDQRSFLSTFIQKSKTEVQFMKP